ncbi:hypothetical protein TEA_028287 [Camellia sinensis var. sinensis]|uniref:mannose-6-phosphate isomerase n=1 Tax=Camellia sinensis var. sinensis TaxID=542762 RepID=A0A4S4ETH9_CAMSN|nr:hypothetical protein TEA_028287 [Camellia sinensis var. sinensis]
MLMESNGSSNRRRTLQRLRCSVKNYDWGRIGCESRVSRLFSRNSGLHIEEGKPYAEFWMGTHESGPSFVLENGGLSLNSWIAKNPNVLGDKVVQKWGVNLPFLFKVLSVAKVLSIQAHPDKELAGILHKARPDVFKDGNHKPEMALALTEFEALCGFISLENKIYYGIIAVLVAGFNELGLQWSESPCGIALLARRSILAREICLVWLSSAISAVCQGYRVAEFMDVLQNVPEIAEVVGSECVNQVLHINNKDGAEKVKAVLRSIFTHLMSASKDVISGAVSKLNSRLNMESEVRQLTEKEQLVLLLEKQYPADVGVLATFLFNYVKLNPGEALYLGANELHAYIHGECIECMATSDNVVRAGLTPKDRDVQILCSMLTYHQGFPEILQGVPLNPYTKRYLPPFEEFEVDRCILPKGASAAFPAVPGPSVFMVMEGEGTMHSSTSFEDLVREGDVLFAPANTDVKVTTTSHLHLYRAGVNSRFF